MRAALWALYRRALGESITSPRVYLVIAVFLAAVSIFTFEGARFFDVGRADLSTFFAGLPWGLALLAPALTMGAWAQERHDGTLDMLLALPTTSAALAVGKFLAGWTLMAAALLMTAPVWITVAMLGAPDNGAIVVGYIGALLMAGSYIALASAASALTASPAMAFLIGAVSSLALTLLGAPAVSAKIGDLFGSSVGDGVASLSPLERFEPFARGVIDLPAAVYFVVLIALGLTWTTLAIEARRGGGAS